MFGDEIRFMAPFSGGKCNAIPAAHDLAHPSCERSARRLAAEGLVLHIIDLAGRPSASTCGRRRTDGALVAAVYEMPTFYSARPPRWALQSKPCAAL